MSTTTPTAGSFFFLSQTFRQEKVPIKKRITRKIEGENENSRLTTIVSIDRQGESKNF